MAEETDLHVLARMSQGSPNEDDSFIIRGKKGDIIAKIHSLEELVEILIFLEGECSFNVDGTDIDIKGGSLLFLPSGVDHGVRYKRKSKVIRIKLSKSSYP